MEGIDAWDACQLGGQLCREVEPAAEGDSPMSDVRQHATGQPARGCRSVTIVAKNATLADALSTGVFVMGPTDGMALIERLPDVEGVIVSSENRVLVSSGLKNRLQIIRQPTDAP